MLTTTYFQWRHQVPPNLPVMHIDIILQAQGTNGALIHNECHSGGSVVALGQVQIGFITFKSLRPYPAALVPRGSKEANPCPPPRQDVTRCKLFAKQCCESCFCDFIEKSERLFIRCAKFFLLHIAKICLQPSVCFSTGD